MKILCSYLLLASFLALIQGCDKTAHNSPDQICHFQTGTLHLPAHKNVPKKIYVDMRDSTGHVAIPPGQLQKLLADDEYEIVDSPSGAGYILHVLLLHEGQGAPESLEKQVANGYGTEVHLTGQGVSTWLADALLVQRNVPDGRRPTEARLKNISRRNAIDSTQTRIGLLTPEKLRVRADYIAEFAMPLAKIIRDSLTKRQLTPDKK